MAMDKKQYTPPYYLIDGKKSNHGDMISVARECGLPINIRKMPVMDFAHEIVDNPDKYPYKAIHSANQFLSRVQGPFKSQETTNQI